MAEKNICSWCDREHGQEPIEELQCITRRFGAVLAVGSVALQNMAYALRRMDELQAEARQVLGLDDLNEDDQQLEQANEEYHAGQWSSIRETYDRFDET